MRTALLVGLNALLLTGSLGCGGSGGSSSGSTTPTAPTAPVTPSNPTTASPPSLTAAFVAPDSAVAFYVFGATLPSGVLNPTWEIETASPSVPVLAAMSGRVVSVTPTSQGDLTVILTAPSDDTYALVHDHVTDVRVTVGQMVTAGMQIGVVGRLNNGRGRTELQLNRRRPEPTVAVCPRTVYTTGINEQFQAAAQRLNGNSTTCLSDTVVP